HDRQAGRAGEAGEPCEPLFGGRHVFVLVAVGARHDETAEVAALHFGAQGRDPGAGCGPVGFVLERLEARTRHGGLIWAMSWSGNGLEPGYSHAPGLSAAPKNQCRPTIENDPLLERQP